MDFDDTPEEAEFRAEAATWLRHNVPDASELKGLNVMERAKLWQKRKADARWACIRWPEEYGGRGASPIQQVILSQEEAKLGGPGTAIFLIGQGMAAPTLMSWATEEQKRQHLPPLASGEKIWCQLFSEPAGGSDLAALTTRAEPDGDDWIINGQKIWTSGAHYSDWGVIVLRTDPSLPKHQGLSYFFLDMKSPGIEIKPIKQMSGDSDFNEVYFNDVRVPDAQRLGAVGQGWQVALTTLMNERLSVGQGSARAGVEALLQLARDIQIDGEPALNDRQLRAQVANWHVMEAGLKYTGYRTLTALSRGETPGPENSITKLVAGTKTQDLASFALDMMEQAGVLWSPKSGEFREMFGDSFMSIPGFRIAGGSDEIMANIIAERVLGLPQDVRLDKGIPFSEVPTSSKK